MKGFNQSNTRNRITLVSVAVTMVYLLLHQPRVLSFLYEFEFGRFISPIVIYVLLMIGFMWVLGRVKEDVFLTIGQFPSFTVFILVLFLELLILEQSELVQVIRTVYYGIGVFTVSQVSMLTANILFVSYQKSIPLGQAARATSYFLSLVMQYLAFFVLFSTDVDLFLRLIGIITIVVYYVYFLLWTLNIDHRQTVFSTVAIAGLVFLFSLILSTWALSVEVISLVLSVVLYVLIGVALEQKQIVSKNLWIEYGFLILASMAIVLVLGEWGINGSIF